MPIFYFRNFASYTCVVKTVILTGNMANNQASNLFLTVAFNHGVVGCNSCLFLWFSLKKNSEKKEQLPRRYDTTL